MRRVVVSLVAAAIGLAGGGVEAQTAGAGTHVLVVSGLGGTPEYAELFRQQATSLLGALRERWGLSDEAVTWLAEDPEAAAGISDKSTRAIVERELLALAGRVGSDDAILLVLLGHGSGQGDDSRLNLPGPDLSGSDLSVWLSGFRTQTVAVVNAASASGGFVPTVAGDRRIIVTATRSARERERTHFGQFFVDAFALDDADTDKDDRVSLLEAFLYAKGEVERYYEADNQMLTEHALLDDNGDGEGSLEPSAQGPDGSLADRFFVAAAPRALVAAAAEDPELAVLLERKTRIESDIAVLRGRRAELSEDAYDDQLEVLLLDLARTNRAIRDRGDER